MKQEYKYLKWSIIMWNKVKEQTSTANYQIVSPLPPPLGCTARPRKFQDFSVAYLVWTFAPCE